MDGFYYASQPISELKKAVEDNADETEWHVL